MLEIYGDAYYRTTMLISIVEERCLYHHAAGRALIAMTSIDLDLETRYSTGHSAKQRSSHRQSAR
jgi:hypothetical protein